MHPPHAALHRPAAAAMTVLALLALSGCTQPGLHPSTTSRAALGPPAPALLSLLSTDPACAPDHSGFILRILASVNTTAAGHHDAVSWIMGDGKVINLVGVMEDHAAAGNRSTLRVGGRETAFDGITPAAACSRLMGDSTFTRPGILRDFVFTLDAAMGRQALPADLDNLTERLGAEFFDLPTDSSYQSCSGGGYGQWTVNLGGRSHNVLTQCVHDDPNGNDTAAAQLAQLADEVDYVVSRAT